MEAFFQDLRFSFRMLVKNPGFTIIALIALALGIGANTAIFSVINAALIRPLPYPEPDRLVSVWETDLQKTDNSSVAPANFFDWREQNQVFEDMAAFTSWAPGLTGGDQPERVNGALATSSLFSVLGIQAAAGRTFAPEEGEPGRNRVVVLSHRLWQRRFASNLDIIGQVIALNGQSFTVIGVMPEDFRFPLPNMMRGSGELTAEGADLWAPLAFDRSKLQRNNHSLAAVARLKSGVTREQAQSEIESISNRLAELYPKSNEGLTGNLASLSEEVTGRIKTALLVLFGAVGFVLLIACANVANLLLARAASRQKEMAIRLAVGASRARVVRQLLAESLLLAAMGGGIGSLIGLWAIDILLSLTPSDIHFSRQPGIDAQVLGFTLALSLITGVIFGLVPALQTSKPDLIGSLKEGGKGSTGSRARARSAFVIAEVALAVVLLVGAGIMLRSFLRLQNIDLGFDPENVFTMQLSLPSNKYSTQQQRAAFFHQVLERMRALAGVESVGLVSHLPLSGDDAAFTITVEGRPPEEESTWTQIRAASPDYFNAMGIQFLKGRPFTDQDSEEASKVLIINEAMARRDWPGEDPIGRRICFDRDKGQQLWREVIGVVRDVRHIGLETEPMPQMYLPYLQITTPFTALVLRAGDQQSLAAAARSEILALDRDQPVYNIRPMKQLIAESASRSRFMMMLLALFASVALLLAVMGVYGVMSYSVTERLREIGIRQALGAQVSDVLKLIIGQGMKMTLAGVGLGLVGAFFLTRWMQSLLFEVSATDPATFTLIPLLLVIVALGACFVPARRATRVDPMTALRCE